MIAAHTVERIEVPARKMSWHEFKQHTVPLALYRVTDPSMCTVDSTPTDTR